MSIYITIHTKEKGKIELTEKEWYEIDTSSLTYHREDGPAIECSNGTKEWYINGKHHREGAPAIEHYSGSKYWHIKGKLHREDGPAIEYEDGGKCWYINGEHHREDGPAVVHSNGTNYWYINDRIMNPHKILLSYCDLNQIVLLATDPDVEVREIANDILKFMRRLKENQ